MLVLAFECSATALNIGLATDKVIIDKIVIASGFQHSELLVVKIEEILTRNNFFYQDLDLVVVGNGPSSFTATRVALTVAKIIKLALHKTVITVNKCELLGNYLINNLSSLKTNNNNSKYIAIVNAFGNNFFCGQYSFNNQKLSQILDISLINDQELLELANQQNNSANFFIFDEQQIFEKFKKCFEDNFKNGVVRVEKINENYNKKFNEENFFTTQSKTIFLDNFLDNSLGRFFLFDNAIEHLIAFGLKKFSDKNFSSTIDPCYVIAPRITSRK